MFRLSARNTAGAVFGVAGAIGVPLLAFLPGRWGLLPLLVVMFGAGTVWLVSEGRRAGRRNELVLFAGRIGWTYTESSFLVAEGLRSYPFGTGVDRADIDVLTGVFQGRACAHFVHRFDERHGGSSPGLVDQEASIPREFQITAVQLSATYPTIDILPQDIVALAAKLVGGMDVDFESAEFNRRWRVKGDDPRYVHDMITPRVMDVLVKDSARGTALRIEGRNLITWRAGRSSTDQLASTLALLTSVAKVLPPHVERALVEEERAREANAPDWAKTPGALTSGHYTALGAQAWAAEVGEPVVVVAAALVDDLAAPAAMLAARRRTPEHLRGRWEFPGGKVDPGETPEQALHRELVEELGVTVRLGTEVVGPDDGAWRISDRHLLRLWLAVVADGEPTPIEHDELRWLAPHEWLDVEWLDADVRIVRALQARFGRA